MIILVFVLISIITTKGLKENLFEAAERKNSRVQKAFKNYEDLVLKNLIQNRVDKDDFQILFIACKSEMRLEIWGGNSETDKLKKIQTFEICAGSGIPGPKRQQGDWQVPAASLCRFRTQTNLIKD